MVLLEKYFAKYPDDASKVVLSVKGGATKPYQGVYDSSAENVNRSANDCLEQLKGRKGIDLFEVARHDGKRPWEETAVALDGLVKSGTIGAISLSEVRAESIHAVAKVAKIAAVEVELSLMFRDVLTNGIAEACAKYNIPMVAYSPMARGLLAGRFKTYNDVPEAMKRWPQFSEQNFPINMELAQQVEKLAEKKGCTVAQLAINWTRCLSKKPGMPTIIPIPGGSTAKRVEENSKLVDITLEELEEIDAIITKFEVQGSRYPPGIPTDT